MLRNKSLLLVLILAILAVNVHAINDMPLIAQFNGEHNDSGYGYSMLTLDFNHDGYDDLVILASFYGYHYQQTPSRGKVYIYYGGPNFSSTSEPAMTLEGDYPEGMQRKIGWIINIGDVDGDGFDDLGISYSQNYIKKFDILWGGSFERQEVLSGVGSISYLSFIIGIGDIDNDGFKDFSIGYLNQEQDSYFSTISIYHGNSQRVFTDSTILTHTSNSITRVCKPLGDLNGDGYDDFFGYADYSGMKLWYGASTSLSENPNVVLNPIYYGNDSVRGIESGDLNGDGYSDVVGASYSQRRFAVWLGNTSMNGHADWQKTNTLENYGYDLAVGDFNGDGYDDVAVSAPFEEGIWPYHDYRGYVYIYAGNAGMVANVDPTTPALAEQLSIRISPNPLTKVNQSLTFHLKGNIRTGQEPLIIEIYNIKGQSVYREVNQANIGNRYSVAPGSLSNGIYYCKVKSGKQTTITKFTVIH